MASRGRPPKHGSSFDQMIKRQCQKGKQFYVILFVKSVKNEVIMLLCYLVF